MASKLEMTIAEVAAKYPQFLSDRLKYEKRVILESLQWRVDHPTAKNLSVRKYVILIILITAVRTVQCTFRVSFMITKMMQIIPSSGMNLALSKVFKDLDKTSSTKALEDDELDGHLIARQTLFPQQLPMKFPLITMDQELKSEAHFYVIIDAVRDF